ncbi:Uncharacterised protein [Candidatus Anstonella stagnisolia]|nr:Uncharacterised protein [Candidatus Anstonella stagnisolia]
MGCMRNGWIAAAMAIVLAFAIAFWFYPQIPDRIAVHWGIEGNADGFAQKEFWIFLVPILMVVLALLLYIIPKMDPKRKNIEQFWEKYCWFIAAIEIFMLYLQALIVVWNMGIEFNMGQALAPAFAGLFYFMGSLVQVAKQNWTIGIRTPWTLSSKGVWEKTHKLGGKLFKACAVLCLLGILLPKYSLVFVVAPVLFSAVYLFAYSYIEYSNERKGK